jgi:hypothetical protein
MAQMSKPAPCQEQQKCCTINALQKARDERTLLSFHRLFLIVSSKNGSSLCFICPLRQSDSVLSVYLQSVFHTVQLPLEAVDRKTCVSFMEAQGRAGLSSLTINRRLAAVSSLFVELNLPDPIQFPHNPVAPLQRKRGSQKRTFSLYRRQPDCLPDVIAEEELQAFFVVLPIWQERTSFCSCGSHVCASVRRFLCVSMTLNVATAVFASSTF